MISYDCLVVKVVGAVGALLTPPLLKLLKISYGAVPAARAARANDVVLETASAETL